jgi:predicted Rossmann fold flavoprotein
MKQITIIWAGAAGIMTAATILEWESQNEYHIHIFEKNTSPGKKVILSGGGRCNVTTGNEDKKILETKYTRGWNFIRKSMGKFGPKKVREWFENHDVPLKIEDDLRVFPVSNDWHDVVWVFEKIFLKYKDKISLHYGEGVTLTSISDTWSEDDKKFIITTAKWSYTSDVLVITTWGNAYSHTGSSGDGYAFARSLWHTVTKLWPSLSSFLTSEIWIHDLSWLSFPSAKIRVIDKELSGSLLLTHFGISWPLAFMTSSLLAWDEISKEKKKTLYFSPLSDMSFDDWNNFLKSSFLLHPKKIILSILTEKLSRRFAESFIRQYFPQLDQIFASSISKVDREKIAELLGNGIPLTLLERRPWDEFVTAGWVETIEIESETMESKIHKNLYFAGEVLNVDGYTGWYSLQICWASGYTAGRDIIISKL